MESCCTLRSTSWEARRSSRARKTPASPGTAGSARARGGRVHHVQTVTEREVVHDARPQIVASVAASSRARYLSASSVAGARPRTHTSLQGAAAEAERLPHLVSVHRGRLPAISTGVPNQRTGSEPRTFCQYETLWFISSNTEPSTAAKMELKSSGDALAACSADLGKLAQGKVGADGFTHGAGIGDRAETSMSRLFLPGSVPPGDSTARTRCPGAGARACRKCAGERIHDALADGRRRAYAERNRGTTYVELVVEDGRASCATQSAPCWSCWRRAPGRRARAPRAPAPGSCAARASPHRAGGVRASSAGPARVAAGSPHAACAPGRRASLGRHRH